MYCYCVFIALHSHLGMRLDALVGILLLSWSEGLSPKFDIVTEWLGDAFVPMAPLRDPAHRVNEAMIIFNELHLSRAYNASHLMREVRSEIPHTAWTELQVERIRRGVVRSWVAPAWLHLFLMSFDSDSHGPLSIANPRLVAQLDWLKRKNSGRDFPSRATFLYVADQWISRCVAPLRMHVFAMDPPCKRRADYNWELSKESTAWHMTDLGLKEYDRITQYLVI